MIWLSILQLVLQLAAFFARQAERADIERSVLNEIDILLGKRERAAVDARSDVLLSRVQPDDADPNRRD